VEILADPITVNCRKVLAGLKMIGADYTMTKIDFFKGEQGSPDYLAINPMATIPAMRDGDLLLTESNSILQYAADKVGNAAAYPTDLKIRADINRWLLWECGSWFPTNYVYLVENCVKPLLGDKTDQSVLDGEAENFHKLAGILDTRLSTSQYITGSSPTIADVAVASPMHLHVWSKLPLQQHANVQRWIADIETHSWWKETHVDEGFVAAEVA